MQRELCARISELLATVPIHDPYGYEALAKLKLPGMSYLEVLKLLHEGLKPKLYVEIGVGTGESLYLADAQTDCIVIDPSPRLPRFQENFSLHVTSSDKFFYHEDRAATAKGFDLAFIDGDHDVQQAMRDFANLEKLAGPHSIIVIRGVIPMDEKTSTPEPETAFHTGDVWRLMNAIVVSRPDLVAFTIACSPTGLGIVGRFGQTSNYSEVSILPPPAVQKFPSEWNDAVFMLHIVDNHSSAWMAALQGQRVAA